MPAKSHKRSATRGRASAARRGRGRKSSKAASTAKKKRANAVFKGAKAKKVMHEFGQGTLRHGSTGEVVHRLDVAQAIAAGEQRKADAQRRARARRAGMTVRPKKRK